MPGYDNHISFLILTSLVSCIVIENQHCVDLSTGVVQGRRYTGYTYQTTTECGFQQCLVLCGRREECQSINYDRSRLHCELSLDAIVDDTMLTLHREYLYVDKTTAITLTKEDDACLLNPCHANSVCLELHDGTTTCIVPAPMRTTNPTTTGTTDPPTSILTTNPTTTGITYPPSSILTTGQTTPTHSAAADCSSPYTYYGDADFCVWAVLGYNKADWHAADSACRNNGGHLAKADSGLKISVVASLVGPFYGGWVGAEFNSALHTTVWVPSLATVEPQPVEHDGTCVTATKDGVLELRDCIFKRDFVCEKDG